MAPRGATTAVSRVVCKRQRGEADPCAVRRRTAHPLAWPRAAIACPQETRAEVGSSIVGPPSYAIAVLASPAAVAQDSSGALRGHHPCASRVHNASIASFVLLLLLTGNFYATGLVLAVRTRRWDQERLPTAAERARQRL